jgi:hypothetical protein
VPFTIVRPPVVYGPEMVTQRELVQAIGRATGATVRTLTLPAPAVRAFLVLSGPPHASPAGPRSSSRARPPS